MPNHLHGLLFLKPTAQTPDRPTLGATMNWFKTMTTNEYIWGVKNLAWRSFPGEALAEGLP
jgi:hypothetical protein